MTSYVIQRVLLVIPTLFFVALITFVLAHAAPGNPFDKNQDRPLPPATIERLNTLYGLDKPLHEQFVLFLGNAIRFDFGSSLARDRSVADIVGTEFPVSAQLGLQALLLALGVAIPLGIVSALRHNTRIDYGSMLFATVGTTIPSFVLAIFGIYIFAVTLHWVPTFGWGTFDRMLLPTVILSLGPMAFLTRITRASMLEAIRQDYVRTARAKGLSESAVIVGHALKNAAIPVATVVGPATAFLITGSFLIETVFSIPGIGREFVQSMLRRDYPVIMAVFLLFAFIISVANLSVDLVYGLLDPRIKVGK